MSSPRLLQLQLLALVAALLTGLASGHAYLSYPPSRNFLTNVDYCPHCLSAGGPYVVSGEGSLTWPAGKHGICGDPWNAAPKNEAQGAAATLAAGSVVTLEVKITAFHKGGFYFRICDLGSGPLSEACLNQHVLQRADGSGAWSWLQGIESAGSVWQGQYRVPAGLSCERCVLQWYYLTGNSCKPPGAPSYATSEGMPTCGSVGPGAAYPEEFWNCADVRVTGGSGGATKPQASPSPSPRLSPSPSPVPKPASPQPAKGWWELPAPQICGTRPNLPTCVCKTEPVAFGVRTRDGSDCRPCVYTCARAGPTSKCCPSGRLYSLAVGKCLPANICTKGAAGASPDVKPSPSPVPDRASSMDAGHPGTRKGRSPRKQAVPKQDAPAGCAAGDAACHCRGRSGNVPAPRKCGAYFECSSAGAWARTCPDGTRFQADTGICNLEAVVACGSRPL